MTEAISSPPSAAGAGVARRANLRFADEEAVIADIQRLRAGCRQAGAWTLPQACWHLDAATQMRMRPGPFPADTPEQKAKADLLRQVLASSALPSGIVSPEPMVPPPDAGDAAIDAFIVTLRRFRAFAGPIAPHRIFGTLADADARRLNLIHCAHHLSYLVPTTQA